MEAGREGKRQGGKAAVREGGREAAQGSGRGDPEGREGREASAHTRHGVRARVMNRRDLSTQV